MSVRASNHCALWANLTTQTVFWGFSFVFLEVVSFSLFFFFKHTTILSKNLQYLLFTTAEKFFINLRVLENQFLEVNVPEQLPHALGD